MDLVVIEDPEGWANAIGEESEYSSEEGDMEDEGMQEASSDELAADAENNGRVLDDAETPAAALEEQEEQERQEEDLLSTVAEETVARSVHIKRSDEGFGFRIAGGDEEAGPIFVAGVVPGSAADTPDGLAHGDRIIAINGASTAMATKGRYRDRSNRKNVQVSSAGPAPCLPPPYPTLPSPSYLFRCFGFSDTDQAVALIRSTGSTLSLRIVTDPVQWAEVREAIAGDAQNDGEHAPLVVKDAARLGEVHTAILSKENGKLGCALQVANAADNVVFSKVADRHHDAVFVGDRIVGVGGQCVAGQLRSEISAALQAAEAEVAVTVLRLVAEDQLGSDEAVDVIRVSLAASDLPSVCVVEVESLEECRLFVEEDVKGIFAGDRLLAVNDHLLLTQNADELYNLLDDLQDAAGEGDSVVFAVARLSAVECSKAFDLPVCKGEVVELFTRCMLFACVCVCVCTRVCVCVSVPGFVFPACFFFFFTWIAVRLCFLPFYRSPPARTTPIKAQRHLFPLAPLYPLFPRPAGRGRCSGSQRRPTQ